MRILFNCSNPNTPAGKVCHTDLAMAFKENGHSVFTNQWDNYAGFDLIFFMGYEERVSEAKRANPTAMVGLCDPKMENESAAGLADFLLVSSPEQQDAFLHLNPNCFVYWMFPAVAGSVRAHRAGNELVIAYHGNKVHLNNLGESVTPALEALASNHMVPIRLLVVYNIDGLGPWSLGTPNHGNLTVEHIQWSEDNLHAALLRADIGIVPNDLPSKNRLWRRRASWIERKVLLSHPRDHFQRYKYSSNPGRIWVFGKYGIPVVSDFFPSAAQFLDHGNRGFIAHNSAAWFHYLRSLGRSPELRQKISDNLREYLDTHFLSQRTLNVLLEQIESIEKGMGSRRFSISGSPPGQLSLWFEYLTVKWRRACGRIKGKT